MLRVGEEPSLLLLPSSLLDLGQWFVSYKSSEGQHVQWKGSGAVN